MLKIQGCEPKPADTKLLTFDELVDNQVYQFVKNDMGGSGYDNQYCVRLGRTGPDNGVDCYVLFVPFVNRCMCKIATRQWLVSVKAKFVAVDVDINITM